METVFTDEKLECGVRLIAEKLPNFRSVTAGIWVGVGSCEETPGENGLSHFIEHMLFKGTKKRTAKQISVDVDNIGGQINAFTSKECTCYYIKVIDDKLEEGLEILTDLFCNATIPADELEKERNVVLEEIAMSNDNPEDLAMELISKTYFDGCALAKTILGPADNIRRFNRDDLVSFMDRYYAPENVLVAAAGNFDTQKLKDSLNRFFENTIRRKVVIPEFAKCSAFSPHPDNIAEIEKDIEQVHICMGMPCFDYKDTRKYPLSILNNIIGGSMSSRLFQKIREELGMAYSVFSYTSLYKHTGMYGIYAGTISSHADQVTEAILNELKRIKKDGITDLEIEQSKEQTKGNYILGSESTSAKMNAIGKAMILAGKVRTDDEILALIDGVTKRDVYDVMDACVDLQKLTLTYVGKVAVPRDLNFDLLCAD